MKCFTGILSNGKLAENIALNANETTLRKINVSFIIYLCLGKYSFSFDTF